jgi:hypothetical protein
MLSVEERRLKEEALAGLTGGSFDEIVVLLMVVPVREAGIAGILSQYGLSSFGDSNMR